MSTKYGYQPFAALLRKKKINQKQAAAYAGVPYMHLRNAGYGYVTAKTELREGMAALLGKPIEELFTAESLAKVPRYGDKGRELMEAANRNLELWLEGEKVKKGHRADLLAITREEPLAGREFELYDGPMLVGRVRDGALVLP